MDPTIWGPHAWTFMHCVTLSYPMEPTPEDKEYMRNFFGSLPGILPCYKCRMNFKTHISKIPLTDEVLSSKEKLVKWLIDIHNVVNQMNGKKIMSYEEAISCCHKKKINYYYYILIFVIVILFLIILSKKLF